MAALEKQQATTEEMQKISKAIFDAAQEKWITAQSSFHEATGDMPGVRSDDFARALSCYLAAPTRTLKIVGEPDAARVHTDRIASRTQSRY